MTTIRIDDKEYDFDILSDEIKGNLAGMQFCDGELQRVQAKGAVLQTARMAYANALNEALKSVTPVANQTNQ